MDEDRGLTCATNWDDWHESLRSDLLRRAEAARHHPDAGWLCRRAPAAMRLPWPTWLHQPSPRRVQSSIALSRARVGVSDSVRSWRLSSWRRRTSQSTPILDRIVSHVTITD